MTTTIPLTDRIVVITGASGGIGASLARTVAARGGVPVLAARRAAELEVVAGSCGPRALAIPADVTREDEVKALAAQAIDRLGHIDVWVNNAGRGIGRPPSLLTEADLDEMFRVNVKSVLFGAQAVLPHFRERRRGHLINVSSMLARVPWATPRTAYSASKSFVNTLTAGFRMELAADHPDIHVSLFTPGVVATDFGLNALGGVVDNRQLPGAQDVDEVAGVIADLMERPRADVYSRPGYRQSVVDYYAAEDLGAYERGMAPPRRP